MNDESLVTGGLLSGARAGDTRAVDQLLARHRERLRRMVAQRMDPVLARRVDASDIVQDALVDAHRRLNQYLQSPVMPFELWLRQIAQDRMIDAHRHNRGAQRRSMDREQGPAAGGDSSAGALEFVDQELTPSAQAIAEEFQRRFHQALSLLPEADREILLLRHFEQLGNQEVAQLLGLTEPAAAMRYLRALKKIKTVLNATTE